jgi:hypothetical protein
LAWAAEQVALLAGALDLPDVAANSFPAPDLARIVLHATASVVATVPLEPAPRVVGMNPAFGAPNRERLARVDAEEIEFRIASLRRELRLFEPIRGELVATVVHVLPAKNTELEHLRRSQLRAKFRIEVTAFRLCKPVDIALLHAVGHVRMRIKETVQEFPR